MADMQVTSARVIAHLKSLRDKVHRASAVTHQTSLAISRSQAEVKRQAQEIARLRKELEDVASKNEAERTLFLQLSELRSAAWGNTLEKELQAENQQVQSLEANIHFQELEGALKTEQEAHRAEQAEQAAHAATSKALETAQTQLEAEAASLASTKKKKLLEADTPREALEKELQAVKKQVQSLEANIQELASKFTQLEGALKTEQEEHSDTDKAYKESRKKRESPPEERGLAAAGASGREEGGRARALVALRRGITAQRLA
jgi:chromosome segregation ATPase